MSLTTNKKKEIINNLGKYRKDSDAAITHLLDFAKNLTLGLRDLAENSKDPGKIDEEELTTLMQGLYPDFDIALDKISTYYESLSNHYVTALNEIAEIKTDKNND